MLPVIFRKLMETVGGASRDVSMNGNANLPQPTNNFFAYFNPRIYLHKLEYGVKYSRAWVRWWFTRKPNHLPRAAHPEWPGYTGVGNKLKFKLEFQAYTSQCLVENTIFSTFPTRHDDNLTPKQIKARKKLVELYVDVRDSRMPFDTELIKKFMFLFDQFFFFGSMTDRRFPRAFAIMYGNTHHSMSLHRDPETGDLPLGFTTDNYFRGFGPYTKINIAGPSCYYHRPGRATPRFYLETLIHEMVHAYINLFMCRCESCYADVPNTSGLTGHGPTFMMLLDCIHRTLGTWDIGLTALKSEVIIRNGVPRYCDELRSLQRREENAFVELLVPRAEGEPQRVQNGRGFASGRATVMLRDMGDRRNPVMEFNMIRATDYRNRRLNVYMADVIVGGSIVDLVKVRDTCIRVQDLIQRDTARFTLKSWVKKTFHLQRPAAENRLPAPNRENRAGTANSPRVPRENRARTASGLRAPRSETRAGTQSGHRAAGRETRAGNASGLRAPRQQTREGRAGPQSGPRRPGRGSRAATQSGRRAPRRVVRAGTASGRRAARNETRTGIRAGIRAPRRENRAGIERGGLLPRNITRASLPRIITSDVIESSVLIPRSETTPVIERGGLLPRNITRASLPRIITTPVIESGAPVPGNDNRAVIESIVVIPSSETRAGTETNSRRRLQKKKKEPRTESRFRWLKKKRSEEEVSAQTTETTTKSRISWLRKKKTSEGEGEAQTQEGKSKNGLAWLRKKCEKKCEETTQRGYRWLKERTDARAGRA